MPRVSGKGIEVIRPRLGRLLRRTRIRRFSFKERENVLSSRVYKFLGETKGLGFANNFSWLFSSVLSVLTKGWQPAMLRQPVDQIFEKALRAKKINRIVEVGPGENSALLGMASFFRKARVKMFTIGGIGREEKDSCKRAGITVIPYHAGDSGTKLGDFWVFGFFSPK